MKRLSVKICGITRLEDAERSIELGAELIGLNFWPGSPRYVEFDRARIIAERIRGRAILVGVWVDPEPVEIERSFEELGIELAQLHGDESPRDMAPFLDRTIKALQVGRDFDPAEIEPWTDAWGYLFECAPAGTYGGSGSSWPYERIAGIQTYKPQILAGGIGPGNVAEAIEKSGVTIIDVCSSVEVRSGIKDPLELERLFREVRHVQETE